MAESNILRIITHTVFHFSSQVSTSSHGAGFHSGTVTTGGGFNIGNVSATERETHRIAWYRGDIFNYRIASELADIERDLTRKISRPPSAVSQWSSHKARLFY